MLIVNLTRTCDPAAVLAELQLVATAWRPHSEIPRLVHAEGDRAAIENVEGVLSVSDDGPLSLGFVKTQPVPAQAAMGRRSGRSHAYVFETDGAGVDLYVIDSGVDAAVSEFGGRVTRIHDAFPFFGTLYYHGTAIASIAAGGVRGIAPAARIFDVRVLDPNAHGTASQANAGLVAALNHYAGGPAVVNVSLGYTGSSNPFAATIDAMRDAGMMVCASAGNDNRSLDTDPPQWPACDPDVICVGAGSDGQRRPYSNHGAPVDIFAMGHGIFSVPGGGVQEGHGTSASTAVVSGALCRLLQDHASTAGARDALLAWASRLDPLAANTTGLVAYLPADRIFAGWTDAAFTY